LSDRAEVGKAHSVGLLHGVMDFQGGIWNVLA
jgi:hypothetical protein